MSNLKILKKKVLITGANGLLGQNVVAALLGDFEVHGCDIQKEPVLNFENYDYAVCDITNKRVVSDFIKEFQPNYIVNAAAFTNVDGCEDHKEDCWKVNVIGVENLAKAARKVNAFLVHISTDYVFDGVEGGYHENSQPNPLGYYGRSKLASENAIIKTGIDSAILRTMVLYGTGKNLRLNFATWLVEMLKNGKEVIIVDDQFGHPTIANDLAAAIKKIIELTKTGIFHVTGSECVSRYDFALKLADVFGFDSGLIKRIKTGDLNQKAPRPMNSSFVLDKMAQELGIEMSNVEQGIRALKRQLTD